MKKITVDVKQGKRLVAVTFNKVEGRTRNPADAFADDKYEQVARRLRLMYHNAAEDLRFKQMDWLHRHEERVLKYRRQVEAGLLTEDDYRAWMRGQLFQQREWALKRGQLARAMVDVDQQAMQIINRGRREVFADNANFIGFRIDQQTGGAAASFGLYNEEALNRLIRDRPNLLPMPKIDKKRDYAWYNEVINDAVTHGILQGEMLDQIVQRIAEETREKSLYVMRRNARTAYTGAQNAGRMEAMRQASEELGIQVKKRWLCTLDDRTRDAHAQLDGQTVDYDKPFKSILGPIMYPGDPDAEPANVYNCRCTLEEVPAGHQWKMNRRDQQTGEIVEDMSYKQWLASKQAQEGQTDESNGSSALKSAYERLVNRSKEDTEREARERLDEVRRDLAERRVTDNQTKMAGNARDIEKLLAEKQREQPREFMTNKQLEKKSTEWLREETAKMAVEWYKTGDLSMSIETGVTFEQMAKMLNTGKSRTDLIKDYKALRKRLKNL